MFSTILLIASVLTLMFWIEYLVFAQVTVRKLEKNHKLKNELGAELLSGWRIFNVARALAMPTKIFRILQSGPLGVLQANSKLIQEHTNQLDRVLAFSLFWHMYLLAVLFIGLMIANLGFGVGD